MEYPIKGLYIASNKGEPMEEVESVEAIAGKGLAGDRYERRTGAYSHTARISDDDRQVTIISMDEINAANAELLAEGKEPFEPQETRRNIVADMPATNLQGLVGKVCRIGEVFFLGVEPCAPCARPSKLSGKEGFLGAYEQRGGIRGRILHSGEIHADDNIEIYTDLSFV